jgi:chromosome segregation ATPase
MSNKIDVKRISDIEESIKEIAKYVKSETKRLEDLLEKGATHVETDRSYVERIEKAKEDIDSDLRILQLLKQDIGAMKSETDAIENKIKRVEEKLPAAKGGEAGDIENRLDFLEREVKQSLPTKKRLEEEAVLRMSIEKKMQDLGKRLRSVVGGQLMPEKKEDLTTIEKRLQEMEKKFEDLGSRPASKNPHIGKRLDEVERRLTNIESGYKGHGKPVSIPVSGTAIASLEKRIEMLEKSKPATVTEYSGPVYDFDKKLNLKISSYLSEQLESFARALDKRFPNAALVEDYNKNFSDTRNRMNHLERKVRSDVDKRLEDLNKDMKSLHEKIGKVESPDLTPLANRVALLEKRMAEIIATMKRFSSRMPVVVE